MSKLIKEAAGLAAAAGIRAGERLVSVNGHRIIDVFDYRYQINEPVITVTVENGGRKRDVIIEKDESADIGLSFETGLMDKSRRCANNCIFCFISQNPPGMRETLYFKDDDWRLSFLTGNYITMTNMTDEDFDRLCYYHLSPMNISVHAVSEAVRCRITGNSRASELLKNIARLKKAGISMNFQIVLCKGINDGAELLKTVRELAGFMPHAQSLSVVPVGLTAYRDGLPGIEPFSPDDATAVIAQIEQCQYEFKQKYGTAFVWLADEFYITAGKTVPSYKEYEDFPQIENGVGMIASFLDEFNEELEKIKPTVLKKRVIIVTGEAAYPFISGLAARVMEKISGLEIETVAVVNDFFGNKVTVSGLLTGRDIAGTLEGRVFGAGDCLFIPKNALRSGEDIFLDDITLSALESQLKTKITAVPADGAGFVRALLFGGC